MSRVPEHRWSNLLPLLLCLAVAALLPTPARASLTSSLDDVSPALPELALELPSADAPTTAAEASPFGPAERYTLPRLSLSDVGRGGCPPFSVCKYANANPTRFTDPTGHCPGCDIIRNWPTDIQQEAARAQAESVETAVGYVEGLAGAGKDAYLGSGVMMARAVRTADHYITPPYLRAPDLGVEPFSQKDVDAIREHGQFAYETLSNLRETAPEALDAIRELGPRESGRVIGGTTFNTLAALEGTSAVVSGGVKVTQKLAGAFKRGGSEAFVAGEPGSIGPVETPPDLPQNLGPFKPGEPAPAAARSGSPSQLSAGRAWEDAELAKLGKAKNTEVWRPSQQDIESAAFKVVVGRAKYTKGGRPLGTTVDILETGGSVEIKGGTKMMESSYQLRLQTYRALKTDTALTLRTTRVPNPTFADWLGRWGVRVESPLAPPGAP